MVSKPPFARARAAGQPTEGKNRTANECIRSDDVKLYAHRDFGESSGWLASRVPRRLGQVPLTPRMTNRTDAGRTAATYSILRPGRAMPSAKTFACR